MVGIKRVGEGWTASPRKFLKPRPEPPKGKKCEPEESAGLAPGEEKKQASNLEAHFFNHSSYFKLHQDLDHGPTPIRGGVEVKLSEILRF